MLAIVARAQQMPGMKLLGERVGQRLSGSLVDVHRPAKGRCDQPGVAHPLQVHPTGPVGEPRRHVPGDLKRQPRLAAATRTGHAHPPATPPPPPPASGVLPQPPEPVSVTTRASVTRSATFARSCSRPTNAAT